MGWSVWPEKLIPHVTKLAINSFSCVNAPSQFAGIAALDGPDESIHHMMEKFDQRRKLIHKGLNDLPGVTCSMPGGAFYAFPNVSRSPQWSILLMRCNASELTQSKPWLIARD